MYEVARVLGAGLVFALAFANTAFADSFPDAISLPEPSSISLFAMGAAGVFIARKFKQRK